MEVLADDSNTASLFYHFEIFSGITSTVLVLAFRTNIYIVWVGGSEIYGY